MTITTPKGPSMGDIGTPVRHIELEPVETPLSVPVEAPEKVPA